MGLIIKVWAFFNFRYHISFVPWPSIRWATSVASQLCQCRPHVYYWATSG